MIGKVLQQGLKGDFGDQRVQNDDLPMINVTDVAVVVHVLLKEKKFSYKALPHATVPP